MKAILLAAGLGTRLRPVTDSIPKCLVPVSGRPLLDIWLEQLTQAGFDDILVNTHYLSEKVETYLDSSPYRNCVTSSYEQSLLGSLGTIRRNLAFIDGQDCLIAHADNYCLALWQEFLQVFAQRPPQCDITMMLFNTDNYKSCGMVEVDADNVLSRYVEKPQSWQGRLANGAVFLASYAAIRDMCKLDESLNDICKDFLPGMVGRANTFVNPGILLDIGTPQTLEQANQIANQKEQETDVV